MVGRNRRGLRPTLERVETRELLSTLYGNLIVDRQIASRRAWSQHHAALQNALNGGGNGSGGVAMAGGSNLSVNFSSGAAGGFVPSTTSIANAHNQGPQGTNLALNPTGTLTPRELRLEQFSAVFKGPYSIDSGRTSTELTNAYIRGAGRGTTFLHGDIQLRIITPRDPGTPLGAVSAIFDRNLNSNTVLAFDSSTPQVDATGQRINIDAAGRPNHLAPISIDVNASAGIYDEAYAIGTMDVVYLPSRKHSPGVLSQGTAIITIHAQIYGPNVAFILGNANINP